MMGKEYSIQPGDDFYCLAQRWGGTCEDFLQVNPNVNPLKLQVGQKIVLPEFKGNTKGQEQFADISVEHGQEFVGECLDEVEMEVEGIRFRVRRIGEPKTPHEVHLILPRVEIRKVQPNGDAGPCEMQIMISNLNIAHSPRLMSGDGDTAEKGQTLGQTETEQAPQQQQFQVEQTPQTTQPQMQEFQSNASPQYGQDSQPGLREPTGFGPVMERARRRITSPFIKR